MSARATPISDASPGVQPRPSCSLSCASNPSSSRCCRANGPNTDFSPACSSSNAAQDEPPPHILLHGTADAPLLWTTQPLSLWGGTLPSTGEILDAQHPLHGAFLAGHILALPSGRGSCSASLGILELILGGRGPVGLILEQTDHIIALGVLIASRLFGAEVPLVVLGKERYRKLRSGVRVRIDEGGLRTSGAVTMSVPLVELEAAPVELDERDKRILAGERGEGVKQALQLVLEMCKMLGTTQLVSVTQAHIDAVVYTGPAGLSFARHFLDRGSQFIVPTTLNAMSVDARRWREQGVPPSEAEGPIALAEAYIAMGATPSLTCAPYLLDTRPGLGEQVAWAESNAVVFANSVLGARTQKYADMMDVLIALTGRAPLAGCHLAENRQPQVAFVLPQDIAVGPEMDDGTLWATVGYHVGASVGTRIPLVRGLQARAGGVKVSSLKAFGAAFATTSGAPMFHIEGVTPECPEAFSGEVVHISTRELLHTWEALNSANEQSQAISVVALGNPHLSLDEFEHLSLLCRNAHRHHSTRLIITCGRDVLAQAKAAGFVAPLEEFGAEIVTDTCWCFIARPPFIERGAGGVMTNSAKFAHYGPGWIGRGMNFGGMEECVDAARRGKVPDVRVPRWARGLE